MEWREMRRSDQRGGRTDGRGRGAARTSIRCGSSIGSGLYFTLRPADSTFALCCLRLLVYVPMKCL